MNVWGLIKIIIIILAIIVAINWIFRILYLELRRDFSELAAQEQSNVTATRKKRETALYRNFLVPLGFPLVTGLGLSLKYKIRNGNFADIWNAIMDLENGNYVRFIDEPRDVSLQEINGMARHILDEHLSKEECGNVGILVTPSKFRSFVICIASMMASINYGKVPHFLTCLPPKKSVDIGTLVIDSWESFSRLSNDVEKRYKAIIVCESHSHNFEHYKNVIPWDCLIRGYKFEKSYPYSPPDDNSDDNKNLLYFTSPYGNTTAFSHGCIVSSIASFIRSFPLEHELTRNDSLAIIGNATSLILSLQMWPKILAVLLHGGSVSFEDNMNLRNLDGRTLLFVDSIELYNAVQELASSNNSFISKLKYRWASAFLTEGVFTKIGQIGLRSIENLRCTYLLDEISDSSLLASFTKSIPNLKRIQKPISLDSLQLNYIRAHLGSRVVFECYCPYDAMGPIAHTNFYDYRILPLGARVNFISCGPISSSLEAKLVQTEQNPELDVSKRQGMLCIRGFTIGKPVDPVRLENARELSHMFGGEGWMPMVGVFGLWGRDGCLYVYK